MVRTLRENVQVLTLYGDAIMIRTAFNNRFRDHKAPQSRGPQRAGAGRRDAGPRRDGGVSRREFSSVVHPWMSLPERLAATQAAMRELAGAEAFQCPLGEMLVPAPATSGEPKPRPAGVNVIIRKRRLPVAAIPTLAAAG